MNKRFSTLLTAGFLLVGALLGKANAQEGVTVDLAKADDLKPYYYIGLKAASGTKVSTAYLKAVEIADKKGAKYATLAPVNAAEWATMDDADKNACLFTVTPIQSVAGTKEIKWFRLTSKVYGSVVYKVTAGASGAGQTVSIVSEDGEDGLDPAALMTDFVAPTVLEKKCEIKNETGHEFTFYTGSDVATANAVLTLSTTSVAVGTSASNQLQFYKVTNSTYDATQLNGTRGSFSFAAIDKVKENVFTKTMKVLSVSEAIKVEGEDFTIPAGTYFATEYSALYAADRKASDMGKIVTAEDFFNCTFITIDPATSVAAKAADQAKGIGFGFKELKGSKFYFYTATTPEAAKLSSGSQISINNAMFTVETNLNEETEGVYGYGLSVKNARVIKEAGKTDQVEIKSLSALNTTLEDKSVVLVTSADAAKFIFKLSDAPIAKPISLLSKTGASVYNILFKSGVATGEKGKYLSAYANTKETPDAFELYAYGTATAKLNTPQYQFVISAVNEKENTITFKNRETSTEFTCVLDTTTTAGVYNIVSAKTGSNNAKFTAIDPKVPSAASQVFTNKTIQLIPATVDAYAGYVNSEDKGYTLISFAKNSISAEKWYMPNPVKDGEEYKVDVATKKDALAGLWEFVKSEKPVLTTSSYAYNNDGKAGIMIKGDTIAFYTYRIRYVDIDGNLYLNEEGTKVEKKEEGKGAAEFVLRENIDGAVTIIAYDAEEATIAEDTKALDMAVEGNKISLKTYAYQLAGVDAIKVYLLPEKLGASLEARGQHVTFEASTGGFVSLNEKNEGIVAIKTAADEDLTFWLDTADLDAILPSFYVSKGAAATKADAAASRLFMFYATDSTKYIEETADPYKWSNGETKVIFKSATLVNADTLTTLVNGKPANVAMKADADGTLAGLANFKFKIFKSADDTYVLRNNKGYLASKNNQLYIDGEGTNALTVFVENQSAPTSNDAVTAETIKVIAGEGQVTIAGAAGKKVVISNILGQVVANTVLASDNAPIAAPAGIVVVAVEGEAAVKAIVK